MKIILLSLLIVATIYDIRYKLIPDYISLLIVLTGFLFGEIHFGGIFVACFILAVCVLYDERYKGGGDIKLIGATGLLLGFTNTVNIYIVSEILVVIFRILYKKIKGKEILEVAYAPFILIGLLTIL